MDRSEKQHQAYLQHKQKLLADPEVKKFYDKGLNGKTRKAKISTTTQKTIDRLLADVDRLYDPNQPTTLQQAQDLAWEAFDSYGKTRRELAMAALDISKDCADAYVVLAEDAKSLLESMLLYELGIEAGERALGPDHFKEGVGDFWSIHETRPYMRARLGLANSLWVLGERLDAIKHYKEMLRLNPNDNQGIRYFLLNALLDRGLDDEAKNLLKSYGDPSAYWIYGKALLSFRTEGENAKSNSLVKAAVKYNSLVPAYLFGFKKVPQDLPDHIGFGDESEAIVYAAEWTPVWQRSEGALFWLSRNVDELELFAKPKSS